MRRSCRLAALTLLCAPIMAHAQTSPAPAAPGSTPPAPQAAAPSGGGDAVIAKVGSDAIHASDLAEAAQGLPEQLQGMPPSMLYPMLLDQLIDRKAIVLAARKQGLQNDPTVQKNIQRAEDSVLQNALLARDIGPSLTDAAIKARYDKEYAGKSGEEEVRAAHILVADEAKAKDIIAQLGKGADFAALAKANSTDPSAAQNNGELGWFKKTDMLPEFSDAAFALQPGQVTQTPVKTRFGWHVIKLEEKRTAPAPALDEVRDEIRQKLIQEGVAKELASAKQGLSIEKFNQDGTPMTDAPPAPGGAAPSSSPAPK